MKRLTEYSFIDKPLSPTNMSQTQSFATSTAKVGNGRSTKKHFGEKKKLPRQVMEHINDIAAGKKTNIVDFPRRSSTKTNIIGYKRKFSKGEVTGGEMRKDKAQLPNRENKLKVPKAIDLDLNASPIDAGQAKPFSGGAAYGTPVGPMIKVKDEPFVEGYEASKYPSLHKCVGSSAIKIKIEPCDDEESKEIHHFVLEGNESKAPKYPHLHKYVGSSATKIKIEPYDDEQSKEIHPFAPEGNEYEASKYPHLHKYVGSSATKIKIEPYDDEQSKEIHPFAPEGNEYEASKYPHLHKYVGSSATRIKIEPCDDEESKVIHPFVPEANDGTGNAKILKFDLNEVPAEDEE